MMKIFVTGATGFVGTALTKALLADGHQIVALTRNAEKAQGRLPEIEWVEKLDIFSNFDHFDAVINLAGEPIFNKAWTSEQKAKLMQSRVTITQQLSALINASQTPPKVFISGSAMGYYGDGADKLLTEKSPPGTNFTAELCKKWEAAALEANTRVCLIRTGIVFGLQGGAFPRIYRIFKWGLGGKLGSGTQYWSWISLMDMVRGIIFLLTHPDCEGPFNFVTPKLMTNETFTCQLSHYLHRPAFFTAPAFMLRYVFGERADLLLDSQKGEPEKLLKEGFVFQNKDFVDFLQSLPSK